MAVSKELKQYYREQGKRVCCDCENILPLDAEHFRRSGEQKYQYRCVECNKHKDKQQRIASLEGAVHSRERIAAKRWRKAGKRVNRFTFKEWEQYLAKHRAAKPDRCYITGVPLQYTDPTDMHTYLNLDHVQGRNVKWSRHSKQNVVPMSAYVNQVIKAGRPIIEAVLDPRVADLVAQCYTGGCNGLAGVDANGNPDVSYKAFWVDTDTPPIEVAECA